MDAGYDELEAAASSYAKASRDRGEDDGRSHRSHRDREDPYRERDDPYRERDREHRHHRSRDERDERDDRHRRRDYDDRERRRDYDDRDRHRDRDYDRRRSRRDDDGMGAGIAEPMSGGGGAGGGGGGGGYRERPPPPNRRYEEDAYAQPMRAYSPPPPPRYRREDDGGWRGGRGDRGGGGGGGGRGRGGRDRPTSPPRSPTPEGTVPLEQRKVDNSMWDVAPTQFDGVGAMAAKMTGIFTYGPGRVPPPAHLGIPTGLIAGSFPPGAVIQNRSDPKKVHVAGFKEDTTDAQLTEFINAQMKEKGLAEEDVVVKCAIGQDKSYAYVDFHSPEEAAKALQLDNSTLDEATLRFRKPSDVAMDASLLAHANTSTDSPNKLFIGGLPTYLNDEQVMELLKSFGELKSFNLVKDNASESKGFAFAEYMDASVTDMAIQGLHNFQLGDRYLVVQRSEVGRNTGSGHGPSHAPGSAGFLSKAAPNILQSAGNADAPTSRVMLLLNMVTPEELYSDEDYKDILEDINDECGKYGEIEGVRIPRPVPKSKKWESMDSAAMTAEKNRKADEEAGVGRVYVMYRDIESTKKAMKAIGGRQFAGRTILVANVSEEEFLGPAPPPPPPPPPPAEQDMDAAAADALKDIMAGLE